MIEIAIQRNLSPQDRDRGAEHGYHPQKRDQSLAEAGVSERSEQDENAHSHAETDEHYCRSKMTGRKLSQNEPLDIRFSLAPRDRTEIELTIRR